MTDTHAQFVCRGVAAAVAGLSLLGYRKLYSGTLDKAQREMRDSLEAVASAVRSEAVFGAFAESRPLQLPASGRTPA
ncbi:MAG TPA: hypothetical protein VM076_18710 [Gemmatimonadaceae bacterium]|nr:hypothetical protein [Gemmatimonadaceae bacterium]